MKKILLLLVFGGALGLLCAQTPAQEINEMLKQYTRQYSFNGSVLVASGGHILLEQGYGYKNVQTRALNDSNTLFQIGSLTKQFTSAIILQLREARRLSLEDKLSQYLPGYPGGDSITIENLLTHTSGIYNYTLDEEFMEKHSGTPIALADLIGLFKDKPLDFPSGTKYQYSNSGYVLLGFIIEKITGKSFFSVVRDNIFKPLHMNHSGFDFRGLHSPDKAVGYTRLDKQAIRPAITTEDSTVSFSAGAMYSSIGDLYRWDRGLYSGAILHDSSLQEAFTAFKNNYGYGWVIDSSYGKKVEMHEGTIIGFSSFIARIPSDGTCIILLENNMSPGLPKIAENINAALNRQPYDFPPTRAEITLDTSVLRQYAGVYRLSPQFKLEISLQDGQLVAEAPGQGKIPIFPETESLFFMKFQDVEIEFFKNPENTVDRLVFHQYGQKITALKIR